MSSLNDLRTVAPPIADLLEERTAKTGLCFLATARADGWPRVSPIELSIIDGRLYCGSMPNGVKAKDLQRDPRCCISTPLGDKDDLAGEVKAFCRARELVGSDEWELVRAAAPSIASFLEERTAKTGLCFVGTTRQDGWPRLSPMELSIIEDRLYCGSMPNAVKAQDLQRDPRCCISTPLADKDDLAGEVKAFCRARELVGSDEWELVRAAFLRSAGFDVGDPGGSHLFELEIEAAAWQRVEAEDWRTTSWRAGEPVRERIRSGPLGESAEV